MATASEEGGHFTIQFAPTIAHWRDQTEDAERVLGFKYPNAACQLALFVHLDTSTASASIKLRIPVGFKEIRSKVNAFVIVHPDRIESLEHGTRESVPDVVRRILVQQQKCSNDKDITRVLVRLTRPSALLLLSLDSFAPSSISTVAAFKLAQSLTSSTLIELYLPSDNTHTACLDAMTAMLTNGLKFKAKNESLSRYYRGQGSRLIQANDLVRFTSAPESPPSYDELGPTPPPPEDEARPQKRPRKNSTSPPRRDPDDEQLAQTRAYLLQEVRKEIREQVSQMEERIQTRVRATCEESKTDLLGRLNQLSQQIGRLVERDVQERNGSAAVGDKAEALLTQDEADDEHEHTNDLDDFKEEANERLYNLDATVHDMNEATKDELSDLIDVRLDDRYFDMRSELQDFVREELENVEDRIKQDLTTAVLTIDF